MRFYCSLDFLCLQGTREPPYRLWRRIYPCKRRLVCFRLFLLSLRSPSKVGGPAFLWTSRRLSSLRKGPCIRGRRMPARTLGMEDDSEFEEEEETRVLQGVAAVEACSQW